MFETEPKREQPPTMREMMERVHQQTEKKTDWVENNSPEGIAKMIVAEAHELEEAVGMAEIGDSAFEVVSEIGDILYLVLRFCHSMGILPEDAVQMKILRNDLKYPDDLNSQGNYGEDRMLSVAFWKAMGGDYQFSQAYLGPAPLTDA